MNGSNAPPSSSGFRCNLRTRALAFVCDDLCATLDEGQLLVTVLPFLMPTSAADMPLARVAYASQAVQQLQLFGGLVGSSECGALVGLCVFFERNAPPFSILGYKLRTAVAHVVYRSAEAMDSDANNARFERRLHLRGDVASKTIFVIY